MTYAPTRLTTTPPTIQRRGFMRTYILDADGVAHGPFWSARAARAWLNEREERLLGA